MAIPSSHLGTIHGIPDEILLHILTILPAEVLPRFQASCQRLRRLFVRHPKAFQHVHDARYLFYRERFLPVPVELWDLVTMDVKTDMGVYPLHYACRLGDTGGVMKLVERGADVNVGDDRGQTPLLLITFHKDTGDGVVQAIRSLIKAGANVNASNFRGHTPLHHAADRGSFRAVSLLLKHGAQPDAIDRDLRTAVHFASANAERDGSDAMCAAFLINGTGGKDEDKMLDDAHCRDQSQSSDGSLPSWPSLPLLLAQKPEGQRKLVGIAPRDARGETPLHLACSFGKPASVALLLSLCHPAFPLDHQNQTPLHASCRSGHPSIVRLLLQSIPSHGQTTTHIDAVDRKNRTALHYACFFGFAECVLILIEAGASSQIADNAGKLPEALCKPGPAGEKIRGILRGARGLGVALGVLAPVQALGFSFRQSDEEGTGRRRRGRRIVGQGHRLPSWWKLKIGKRL
ncbi:ankyrin [Gonapodya prolifera JEL478]|uniref:Ankyrin n=1 Tax=Gonapodya prolifera (strain JEL478) TaxID=1344416 RepID=A0A139A4F2_GONPJ|nr:ankyrin [Gonapodya prolifera JEL478]|eukprot:KXS11233.1 ankyrin [Gonapodya prolifera JEL478]